MPNVDSLRITVTLDAGSNADFGSDWQATWDEQNWVESNEADNVITKMIYLDSGLTPPANLQLNFDTEGNNIQLQWTGDRTSSYKVYSSISSTSGFSEDTSGSFSGNNWTAPRPLTTKFYYVVTSNDTVTRPVIPISMPTKK